MNDPLPETTQKTIPSIFLSSAEQFKDHVAFKYYDGSWKTVTYSGLLSLTNHILSLLYACGTTKGDSAAIFSENRPEWCASYMAIVMCGGTAVPIDAQLGEDEVKNLLADSGAKVVFYSSKSESNVLKAISDSGIQGINFDLIGPPAQDTSGVGPATINQISADDTASIIYTSGTTGKPKGVALTHRNFCSDAEALVQARVVSRNDNVLSILPLHHTYPFMCTFLVPLFIGAAVTFSPGLKASELVPAIRDMGVTIVISVPRLLEMIRNSIIAKMKEKKRLSSILIGLANLSGIARKATGINAGKLIFHSVHANFGRLKFFASGGARLEPSVMNDLEALGFTVLEGYGLTETSPVITFNPPEKRKAGSTGKALPGAEIMTADDGEIMVRGSMVMAGYYKNETATKEVLKDGWFSTGDIGYLDEEGYLFITGRKKEVIVLSSGKNIYPEDIEKAYLPIPLIKELCVVPHRHPSNNTDTGVAESIDAVIVPDLEHAKKAMISNISDALKWEINIVSLKLPEHMRIKGYTLSTAPLPRTALGKLRRFMISSSTNATTRTESAKKTDFALVADDTGRQVVSCIEALMDEKTGVHASDNLELDLGFDSLKKVELVSSLENRLSISLPEEFITAVQTVGDLVSALERYQGNEKESDSATVKWKDILGKKLSDEDTATINYQPNLFELSLVCFIFFTLKLSARLLFRMEIKGTENIPKQGPFVITPNHASYLDAFIIGVSVPFSMFREIYFLGLKHFFTKTIRSWLAKLSHVIPIDQETYLNRALQMSAHVLEQRKSLCIFPEGGRSFDGSMIEFKKGIGILSLELNVPVIPVYIKGAFAALPRDAKFIRMKKIEVIYGKPVYPSDIDWNGKPEGLDKYQFFANELKQKIMELSDSENSV